MQKRFSIERVEAWVTEIFERHGASHENAGSVARALVCAEADGLSGHGLWRVPSYLAMLKSGKIDGSAVPTVERPRPAALVVSAEGGFAFPAIDLAIKHLPECARETGMAAAGISCSNHAGALGLHVEALAQTGLIALCVANTPAAIAPWGGRKAVFGTNPIAFASPLPGRPPLVVDFAISKVPKANVAKALETNAKIPEGWALDADGRATIEPREAMSGTMVPMGDAKGAALALVVEVLAACLVGANLSIDASSFIDGQGPPPNTGQFMLAIDPHAFGNLRFGQMMSTLVEAIESQPGARLAGTRRLALRAVAEKNGIVPPDSLTSLYGTP
jgi:(2R)-3-sulfolactate dehydrogenase (NADP+)